MYTYTIKRNGFAIAQVRGKRAAYRRLMQEVVGKDVKWRNMEATVTLKSGMEEIYTVERTF